MNATEPLTPPPAPSATAPWSDAARADLVAPGERPTFGEMLGDILPVIGVIVVAGPPVVFLAAPWLLLALMLSGPFALLVAVVVVGIAAAALLVTLAAILAAAYVLVGRLQRSQPATPEPVPAGISDRRPRRVPALQYAPMRTRGEA